MQWRNFFLLKNLAVVLLCGVAAWLGPVRASGQTLPSRAFSLAEGLPETSVMALTQDGQGRLWVVSEVGAAWYDGHEFHSLTTRSGLPNTRVMCLAADPGPAAGLWLGLRDGSLCYFNPATNRVRRVMPRIVGRLGEVRAVLALDSGATRRVWVGTGGGELYCLRWPHGLEIGGKPQAPVVQRVPLAATAGLPAAINSLAPGPPGSLCVATDQGLRLLDEATGRLLAPHSPLPAALANGAVLGLSAAADGRLWCGTPTAGLFVIDPAATGGGVRSYTTAQGLCSDRVLRAVAAPGPAGRVWVLTGDGLCYLDHAQAATARCLSGTGLVSHSYRRGDLLLDREGNLWTTSAHGVTQYPPDGRFVLFGEAEGLPGPKTYSLARSQNGDYWVGTNDGLTLLHPGAPAVRCRVLPRRQPAAHNIIRALLVRANGDVWAGAAQGGTAVWEPSKNHWRQITDQVPPLRETTVTSMVEDGHGRVWLATETNGLIIYDPATGAFEQYVGPTLAGVRRVVKVYRSHSGAMWLATEGVGLIEAQETASTAPGAGPALRFRVVAPRPASAEPLSLFSISEDGRGQLWLSSFGEGIFYYNPAQPGAVLHHVPLRDEPGAHVNNPYFVQCDAAGAVWLGTTRGLMRYNPATGLQTFFGREDGFIGQETGLNAVLAEPDGTLWAGTVAGLMRYTPGAAVSNRVPPYPRLTGLRLFMRDTTLQAGVALPHQLNHLTFDYGAISLTTPGRVRYKYRLAGFENSWAGPTAARSATYTNLPPGGYTFEVQAANESGVWSARPATFAFLIAPPWWRTWWAYGLYAALFGLLLYGVRRYTQERERQRADRQLERQALGHLQELDRVKTDFFTNVSHELRTPLTLILGPAEALAAEATDPTTRRQGGLVLRNARKLLSLINQLLDLSKLEAGALRLLPTSGDVDKEARRLVASFSSLAESREIALRCEVPAAPVPLVFDAGKLEEILTNLLANALRFTPAGGEVVLTVAETPTTVAAPAGSVVISVRDTGSGIAEEDLPHLFDRFYQANNAAGQQRTGTGIGLALVRELTALHGGTVAVSSTLGAGATFTVTLPRVLLPVATLAAPSVPSLSVLAAADFAAPAGQEEVSPDADLVLIIEDNDEVREFIRATLAPAGYRVLLAADGLAGVTLALAEVPDLIISDVMMPGLNGYQVCQQLKADPATSHIPMVLLTAKSDPDAKLEGLETGADAFLAKPFNPRELQAQVRNLLALRHRLQVQLGTSGAPAEASPQSAGPSDVLAAHTAAIADLPSLDQEFLRRVNESILRHLSDENFGVDELGADIGMGRTQIHRKLKALTGQSPGEGIRVTRLNRALAMLRARTGTVAEVAFQVGFTSATHFSTAFSRQFGFPPSAAARQVEAGE